MRCFKGTLIVLVCLFFIFSSNPGRKKFTVKMECFSSWGFPYIYKLTERGLYIYADTQVNPAFTAYKEVYMKALSPMKVTAYITTYGLSPMILYNVCMKDMYWTAI